MLTIAFDTSFQTAAVALLRDELVLYDVIVNSSFNHSETLLSAIEQACRQLRLKIGDVDLFACTLGPGSFTGLRIGVSTLKGLLLATGKPAVGVSSLMALALNVTEDASMIYSVMDAGRGQVYAASYGYDDKGILQQISPEEILDPREITLNSNSQVTFVGTGAIKYRDILAGKAGNVRFASSRQQYILASAVGILGRAKFNRNELLNPDIFVPVYLRGADAKPGRPLFDIGRGIIK